jgi:chitodextrinase
MGRWAAVVVASMVVFGVGAIPAAAAPVVFSRTPIAGWSTNGQVRAVLIVGDTVYAGGSFTQVRGPGGTPTAARTNLAAFDARTGALRTAFAADTNGRVTALASDGTRLFVGGDFTTIKSVSRSRLASLDLTTGNLNTGFTGGATSWVYALKVSGDRLYVGGAFGTLSGAPRSKIGAVSTITGAVDPTFNPNANDAVHGIAVSPDGNTVYVGGDFTTINGGVNRPWIAPVSPVTGALLPLTFQFPLCCSNSTPSVLDLDISPSGDRLFGALGGYENEAVSWSTVSGRTQWTYPVDGDTQAVRYYNGNVYFGFHEGALGDGTVRMLVADATTGANVATYRLPIDSFYGVWDIDVSPVALAIGGEFANVNGVATQGVAILPPGSNDPVPPGPPSNVRVTATSGSSISLAWDAGTDNQAVAGYRVLRNGVEVAYPTGLTYTDVDLPASTDFTYQVQTLDAAGNLSTPTTAIPAGTDTQLIPLGSVWRYLDNGSNQGTAWRANTFNDSAWASGPAQLGYGDGDEATVVGYGPDPNNKYATTYFRRQIQIANPSSLSNVNIQLMRDDGAVVYVNGVEVARSNMPSGTISSTTWASTSVDGSDESALYSYSVDPARFVAGTNTIAVEIHQAYRSSSDISFDLALSTARRLGLAAPSNLRTTAVAGTSVGLAWDSPGGSVASYRVYRDGALVGSPTGTTFTDTGLTSAQTYSYTVSAVDGSNVESAPTAPLPVTTLDTVPPSIPTGLAQSALGTTTVGLTWTASSDNVAVTGYDVLRNGSVVGTTTGTTYTDSNLTAATGYSYTVRARDAAGNTSSESTPLPVTTLTAPPTNLRTTAVAGTSVALAWDAPSGSVAGYRVYRGGTLVGSPTGTTFTDTGLTSAQTYSYTVTAVSPANVESGATPPLPVTTPDTVAPSIPGTPTTTTVTATSVGLTWTASSDNVAVTGYDVLRDGSVIATTSGTTYTDGNRTPSTAYSYTVRARDAAGNTSSESTPLPVTTLTAPPTNLRTTSVAGTSVALAWDAPSGSVAGYRVYRGGTLVGSPTGTTFTDTGLTSAQTYSYTVTAVDGSNVESAPTAPLPVTTPDTVAPSIPGTPTTTTVTATSVGLTWTASSDNVAVTGYDVLRNGTLLTTVATTSYTDATASAGQTYSYTVRARDAAGNTSLETTPLTVVTPAFTGQVYADTFDSGSFTAGRWATQGATTVAGSTPGTFFARLSASASSAGSLNWSSSVLQQNRRFWSFRAYIRVESRNAGQAVSLVELKQTGGPSVYLYTNPSTGRCQAAMGSSTVTTTINCADGAWHLVEMRGNFNTSTYALDWRIDGNAQTSASLSGQTPATVRSLWLGEPSAGPTNVQSWDNVQLVLGDSTQPFLGPLTPFG